MNNTLKLLTIALVLTMAMQSQCMWSTAARFISAAKARMAAQAHWTRGIAKTPVKNKFAAQRMLYAGATTALVASVNATSATDVSKSEATRETEKIALDESRSPEKNWTEMEKYLKLRAINSVRPGLFMTTQEQATYTHSPAMKKCLSQRYDANKGNLSQDDFYRCWVLLLSKYF